MDEFDVDTYEVVYERPITTKQETCCGQDYIEYSDKKVCPECGAIVFIDEFQCTYADNYNSGPSSDKSSIRMVKHGEAKSFIVFSPYELTKEIRLKHEFETIRTSYPILDDSVVNEAMELYDKVITKNGIVKKKNRKLQIQKACIYIVYENRGQPRSKTEFARMVGEPENAITKGYNFILAQSQTKNLVVINKTSIDLIGDFVIRHKPDALIRKVNKLVPGYEDLVNRFLRNMVHYIKNNNGLHLNKHPECLGISIIYFASLLYRWGLTLEELKAKSSISIKNMKTYADSLFSVINDKKNKYYPGMYTLIKMFVRPVLKQTKRLLEDY